MDKLEMLDSFKQRFQDKLNPNLESIKYCQHTTKSLVEIKLLNDPKITTIDLKFMGGEIIKNEDGTDKDILPLFNPDDDIVDNANRLLKLDDYSLINCLDVVLTKNAINNILAINFQTPLL
jgi:hypothetical protein